MTDKPYIPVNCEFHDELEAASTLNKQTILVVSNDRGEHETIRSTIKDFHIENGIEYLILGNDRSIRLDHIESIDGITRPKH